MSRVAKARPAALRAAPAFDAAWYATTYPDVALTNLDPAEHYLRVGLLMNRDPSPGLDAAFHRVACRDCRARDAVPALCLAANGAPGAAGIDPDWVLRGASNVAELKGAAAGATLAEAHLPSALAHTALLLRANAALERGDEAGWTRSTNAYLRHLGDLAIALRPGPEPAFARLAAAQEARPVTGGPLISVIMPAWNAEATVAIAARSILDQSWRNLELVVVDDASTDGTWRRLRDLAARDGRLRLRRNARNTGPYIAKNLALRMARGDWITGHDADDWAHPERIARHMAEARAAGAGHPVRASLSHMLRIEPDGRFSFLSPVSRFSFDGAARICSVATLFERDLLATRLGHWDSVRFGADAEMLGRARAAIGDEFVELRHVSTLCLDLPTGLTNIPSLGVGRGFGTSPVRIRYRRAWEADLERRRAVDDFYMPFPQPRRRFAAPPEMLVPAADIGWNLL